MKLLIAIGIVTATLSAFAQPVSDAEFCSAFGIAGAGVMKARQNGATPTDILRLVNSIVVTEEEKELLPALTALTRAAFEYAVGDTEREKVSLINKFKIKAELMCIEGRQMKGAKKWPN
jgi:hypothetical protein